jgi:signal transduction histidine kinase
MTLKLRLQLYVLSFALALLLLAAVSLAALTGNSQKLGTALAEYGQLRWGYETGLLIMRAREAVLNDRTPPGAAYKQLQAARASVDLKRGAPPQHEKVAAPLDRALQAWRQGEADRTKARAVAAQGLNDALSAVTGICQNIRLRIDDLEQEALAQQRDAVVKVRSLAALLVFIAIGVGWRHYRAIVGPVQRLRQASRQLAGGRWDERLEPRGDRELADTAADFNRMAQQLQTLYLDLEEQVRTRSAQLVRSERLATVGLLAAGVAHEINNPLAIIAGQAELARDHLDPQTESGRQVAESLKMVVDETQRCKAITHKLLSLSRPSTPRRTAVDLRELVITTTRAVLALAQRKGCGLCLPPNGPSILVEADDMELRQVLVNLLLNAIEAVPTQTGLVELAIECDDHHVQVTVADNGAGMEATTLARLFEPFFTLRPGTRPGQGLGLAVSHAIVASHGGELSAQSPGLGLGSRFIIRLPRRVVLAEVAP